MNCDKALGAFAGHLDGEELAAAAAAALDAHLAGCAACRAQAKELAATHRDLLMLRATEGRAPKREPVVAEVKGRPSTARPSETTHRYSIWVEAAAAVVLAAILAFLLWPRGQPPETGPQKTVQTSQLPAALPRVGRVVAAQGRVEGTTAKATAPVAIGPDAEILAGQEIHVGKESYAELVVQDGIRMRLESVSVVRFDAPGGPGAVMLKSGQGRFEVTKRDAPWRLQTPNATVESKGGVFVVTVNK